MRDDDFRHFMGGGDNSKHFSIIFLICILMVLLLIWSISAL